MSQKLDSLPPKNSRPFNWSGFYIGFNAGGASAASRINSSIACKNNDPPVDTIFSCPFTTPDEVPGSTTAAPLAAAGTGKISDGGFTGGGQVGYNLQTGGFVFGLELDAESFRLGASRSVATAGPIFITSFDTNWLFTARTRIGLPVTPSLLLYATTGFALTDLSVGNSVTGIGAASSRGLVTGRTMGAGAEWALNRDWTLRGEYLYVSEGIRGMRVYDVASIANKGFSQRIITAPFSPLGQDTHIASQNATCVALPTNQPINPLRNIGIHQTLDPSHDYGAVMRGDNEEQPMHPLYNYAFITDSVEGLIVTNVGVIELELYPDKAPETVKNFLEYVDAGFYNGTMFHRPDCRLVAGKDDVRPVSADADLKPCRICDPLTPSR